MKLAVMQPYLFPYIGYFQLLNLVDKFVIYDDVNYINRGWINRNRILLDEKEYLFTMPLVGASQNKRINQIDILDDGKTISKLIKIINVAYKKAPFFSDVFPVVEQILLNTDKNLAGFITYSLNKLVDYLKIDTVLVHSSSIYKNSELKAQNRILDICIREKADHYINPIGGKEIYDDNLFKEKEIELNFIQTDDLKYSQFNNDFVPGLSIIDVLMFNSVEAAKELLLKYQLVK